MNDKSVNNSSLRSVSAHRGKNILSTVLPNIPELCLMLSNREGEDSVGRHFSNRQLKELGKSK